MAFFKIAASNTIGIEGGYSNHPNDYGGETNFGISKRSYPNLDIKNLTRDDAITIYKRDFWDRYRIEEIKNQEIANYIFDMLININPIKVGNIVQKALGIKVDGIIGSKTIFEINSSNTIILFFNLRLNRIKHYNELAASDESQLPNLVGWIRRALK